MNLTKHAIAFRRRHQLPAAGVVIFWGGLATSWGLELPPAADYAPGNIALTHDGDVLQAAGGNPARGAERWEPAAA